MKLPLFPLLCVSLAANAAFALVFGLGARPAPPTEPASAVVVAAKPVPPPLTPEIWPALQTDALPEFVARLRAAGFPPDLVRAVVAAQISESFAARRRALTPAVARLPFWKDAAPDPKNEAALRQLYREQEKVLHDLLGDSPDAITGFGLVQAGGQLDFLPPAKVDDVRRLLRDFADRRNDLYAEGTYQTNREKLTALDAAQGDALARLLTPAELLDYDVRQSNTARSLRNDLSAFDPTEEEFRAIFQLRQPYDQRYEGMAGFIAVTPEQTRQREAANQLLKDQIAALLPPERAAAYTRSTDYNFRETNKLITRLALPPETAVNLWSLQQEYYRRNREINDLPADQRAPQFTAVKNDLTAKLTPLLSPTLTPDLYRQYGGSWTSGLNLQPKK